MVVFTTQQWLGDTDPDHLKKKKGIEVGIYFKCSIFWIVDSQQMTKETVKYIKAQG